METKLVEKIITEIEEMYGEERRRGRKRFATFEYKDERGNSKKENIRVSNDDDTMYLDLSLWANRIKWVNRIKQFDPTIIGKTLRFIGTCYTEEPTTWLLNEMIIKNIEWQKELQASRKNSNLQSNG